QGKQGPFFSEGYIPIKAINSTKVAIELKLLDIATEIAENRKTLTSEFKKQIETGAFMKKMNCLIIDLPQSGRFQYDSENLQKFKPQIDFVINTIIKSNKDLQEKFNTLYYILTKRDNEIIKAYTKINISYEDKLLRDKVIKDLYRRLGNTILYFVKEIRQKQAKLNYETTNRLKLKRIEKAKRKIMLDKCLKLNDVVNQEIVNSFEEYLHKLDEANYKRLKEEGYLE
ncbi:MAG: relaxase MobL, partial [Christensenellales bacterium]